MSSQAQDAINDILRVGQDISNIVPVAGLAFGAMQLIYNAVRTVKHFRYVQYAPREAERTDAHTAKNVSACKISAYTY